MNASKTLLSLSLLTFVATSFVYASESSSALAAAAPQVPAVKGYLTSWFGAAETDQVVALDAQLKAFMTSATATFERIDASLSSLTTQVSQLDKRAEVLEKLVIGYKADVFAVGKAVAKVDRQEDENAEAIAAAQENVRSIESLVTALASTVASESNRTNRRVDVLEQKFPTYASMVSLKPTK